MDVKRDLNESSTRFFNSKSGQITVFIIVGVLILFIFAGILYLTNLTKEKEITAEGEPVISVIPKTFEPIQYFTELCIHEVAKDGLTILGEQGGYIYPETLGDYSLSAPTDSDGLNLGPVNVPYWHFNIEPNKAKKIVFSSHKPELITNNDPVMSVEGQLESYLEENIDHCLNGYTNFVTQGFKIDYVSGIENKEASVKIGEDYVSFWLKTEVVIKKDSAEQRLDQFFVKVPLNLKHYFEVAEKITNAERETSFLEKQGMELITIYGHRDNNYLAPTTDSDYKLFSPHYWNEGTLKEKIKGLLVSYVSLLRYLASDNFHHPVIYEENFLAQKVIDNMVLPLLGADDLEVSFDYFGWEPYFKVNSDQSGAVKPGHMFVSYGVLNFGHQIYDTHYSVSYPVLVTLRDNLAFSGEGYNFVFALESNIRNNRPAIAEEVLIPPYPTPISSLFCNEDQRDTEFIKSVVVDSFSKEPIELVRIGFTIPEQAECEIGMTDQEGAVEEKYPAVYGGVVNLVHPEYLTEFYPLNTYKNKDHPLLIGYAVDDLVDYSKVIEMHRKKLVNVQVKKKNLQKCVVPLDCSVFDIGFYKDISCDKLNPVCFFNGGASSFLGEPVLEFESNGSLTKEHRYYFSNSVVELTPQEEVFVNLERVSGFHDQLVSADFNRFISLTGNETKPLQLVPGKYKVTAITTVNKPVKIPTEKRCFHYTMLTVDKEECFTLDETLMGTYLSGGVEWDTEETYLEITAADLYTAENLTFYVLDQNILSVPETFTAVDEKVAGRVVEDLQVPAKINALSKLPYIQKALLPIFD